MLKSCKYCGRVHQNTYICEAKKNAIGKQKKRKGNSQADRFRWSYDWQNKRAEIRQRDRQVCQICIRGLYEPDRIYETDNLSVHHIKPLSEAYEHRLDNEYLITLCERHHHMAETGQIPQEELIRIAKEQEDASSSID